MTAEPQQPHLTQPRARPPPACACTQPAAAPAHDEEALDTSDGGERIFARPDGYYWLAPDGKQEIGPFDTFAEAMADMDSGDAAGWTPGETLAEAESEIGVADWIDARQRRAGRRPGPTHLERE